VSDAAADLLRELSSDAKTTDERRGRGGTCCSAASLSSSGSRPASCGRVDPRLAPGALWGRIGRCCRARERERRAREHQHRARHETTGGAATAAEAFGGLLRHARVRPPAARMDETARSCVRLRLLLECLEAELDVGRAHVHCEEATGSQ
jgi:hypothetical protein